MATKRKAMDSSELLKSLRSALFVADKVPDGWYTLRQLSKEWNVSGSHAYRLTRKAVEAGLMQQDRFRIQTEKRGIYPTWHYRSRKAS
jgi:predicted transcriptional regulator